MCAGGIEDGLLKLVTCLANSREEHMIGQPEESDDEESGEEEEGNSGSEEESDSGSEHDSGEPKAAGSSGSEHEEEEAAGEANGHDAEGGGSHSGDDRHPHKDSKKVGGQLGTTDGFL